MKYILTILSFLVIGCVNSNIQGIYSLSNNRVCHEPLKIELTNSETNNLKKFSINFIEKKSNAQEFSHMKKIYDPMIEKNDKRFIKTETYLKVNNKTYINNLNDNESMKIYDYYGYWKPLNKDIIKVSYYEDSEVKIQDNKNNTITLQGIPYINKAQTHFTTFYIDYEQSKSIIDLYEIENNHIKHISCFETEKWIIWDLAWNDNILYIKVTDTIWNEKGFYSTDYKYKKLIIEKIN
ncbi:MULTISPECIES: hypothetical protein [unclassified Gilliamella]|uniref:hypothetical protein n=1 Tax=unclassified Gilliamella TaxID=2685620 RepID=UPI00226A6F6A|nr:MULTISPECIES: hypothetical protein [unclassified Gilliamella]MCX8662045.1 hypothetical protein [Gilliamella sp. B2911]MCX8675962.1 hypothetical protein [Gilliamella sp. B3023]